MSNPGGSTDREELLGEAVGVREVLARAQDGVVCEKTVEDVQCLANRTRDRLRAEDRGLVRRVGVDRDRAIVVAEVPRVEPSQQGAFLDLESLSV